MSTPQSWAAPSGQMRGTVYARLVERLYAMPPERYDDPLEMTWPEFVELWAAHHPAKGRAPTMTDALSPPTLVLGRRIALVDEYGLRIDPTPPPPGKLRLHGGPRNGEIIPVVEGGAYVCIPAMLGYRTVAESEHPREPRFYLHRYGARTGIYVDGHMPSDHPATPWRVTLFGPRVERVLAWWDRRRR